MGQADHHPLAHGADTLDVHADLLVGNPHQHRAAGVADVEVHVGVSRKIGLPQAAQGHLRQLLPAVLLPQGQTQNQIGAKGLPLLLHFLHAQKALPAVRGQQGQDGLPLRLRQGALHPGRPQFNGHGGPPYFVSLPYFKRLSPACKAPAGKFSKNIEKKRGKSKAAAYIKTSPENPPSQAFSLFRYDQSRFWLN